QMDPIDLLVMVDKSNSMLFPSGLIDTGKSVTLRLDGQWNVNNINALNLDKSKVHYVISDPTGTATVWAIWFDGRDWLYQDASYYVKAQQNNAPGYKDPNETAIFPSNKSYTDQRNSEAEGTRSNGGGLGLHLGGSGLGKDIDAAYNDTKTYKIYTSMDEYNRLHYLEEALTNMIYQLSDINHENRVTLVTFTKAIGEDIGPLELTPDNTEYLVSQVQSISTSGGTRQDIALKYMYENHLNNPSENYNPDSRYNYSLLITDGAPVLSSGSEIDNLGGPNDAASTTANSVYAQIKGWASLVRSRSTLMTVGLGMDNVESGKEVLKQIATNNEFYCALTDASQLVENMRKIIFDSFRPHETVYTTGDITDEISDSFYPVAWTDPGYSRQTGRTVLVNNTGIKDWVLLQTNDWITIDGKYTTAGADDAAGQLLQKDDGTFYVIWKNVPLSDPYIDDVERIAWVEAGSGASTGRTVVATENGKDWILLNEGDWIETSGKYYSGTPSYWGRRYYGQITKADNTYSVSWGSSANGNSRQKYTINHGWEGKVYLKAKEDFIGGNAINTNKDAFVTLHGTDKHLDKPTVNVHLLDMNEMSSETTVFKGDIINSEGNSPFDSVYGFYGETEVTKLISCDGDVMNKVEPSADTGLGEAVFRLKYAIGRDLTAGEWNSLKNGYAISIPYVYDSDSSGGPVGYFTFSLEKTGIAGANPAWDEHTADAA
ncbi:MAG: VWA domain-containing protein, partial [Oscillospiraceae bacterium]|nr:VWA domain-containing protein [Oscillospiraceae bacterium]